MASNTTTSTQSAPVQKATTPEAAETLLKTLSEGDRVRFNDDEWKVTDVRKNARGTPFVGFKAQTGYHPGTKTLKPGSSLFGAVTVHGRGMPTGYGSIEVINFA